MLGSVHFVDDFALDHKAEHWNGINVDATYHRYFEESISLAQSGIFNGIAHPDAIKLFGHKPSYSLTEYYASLAKELSKNNNVRIITASDAHCPEEVGDKILELNNGIRNS